MNLPVMCITKHFPKPGERKEDDFDLQNEHGLSQMMTNDSEIEKYSKFVEERQNKIDLWHRQFENMTIEESGIMKTFSEFEIMELENELNSKEKSDGRFNMIFANEAIQKIIHDYQGKFLENLIQRPILSSAILCLGH